MKLTDYLKFKNIRVVEAAKQLSVTRQYVYAVLAGRETPGRELATRIIKWSDGAVRYEDLWG